MAEKITFSNGVSLYLLNELAKFFGKIFCKGEQDNLRFICAKNILSAQINNKVTSEMGGWGFHSGLRERYAYIFNSEDVKRNIKWFSTKSNANKRQPLIFELDKKSIKINNVIVDAKIETLVNNPPIYEIPIMKNGTWVKISSIEDMIKVVNAIDEEIIQIELKCKEKYHFA